MSIHEWRRKRNPDRLARVKLGDVQEVRAAAATGAEAVALFVLLPVPPAAAAAAADSVEAAGRPGEPQVQLSVLRDATCRNTLCFNGHKK